MRTILKQTESVDQLMFKLQAPPPKTMSAEAPLANELEVQCIKDQLNAVKLQLAEKSTLLTHYLETSAR